MKDPQRLALALRLAFGSLVAALPADACPICIGSLVRPPCFAEQVIAADQLAIARADGSGTFVIEARLRGDEPAPGARFTLDETSIRNRALLAFQQDSRQPTCLGPYSPSLLEFMQLTLPLTSFEPASEAGWTSRLERFRPYLSHSDPRISSSAWTTWALAPYRVLRQQQPLPDRATLLDWLDDPTRAGEASLYWTLLGLQADSPVKHRLRQTILTAWRKNDSAHLAALLDAELSANGRESIAFITRHYVDDQERTLDEIHCALLALRMHANEGHPALREPIARSFEAFVSTRRPLSGLVAADLQAWKCWRVAPLFKEILTSGEPVLPSSRPAILAYLEASPLDEFATATPDPGSIRK